MTHQTDPQPAQWTNRWHNNYAQTIFGHVSTDAWMPLDPFARELEMPWGSPVFQHLAAVAGDGGTVYLTRFGRRVAAVVAVDVAESLEASEPDREPGAGVREIVADWEARLDPVPPEIAAEVDRQWAAAAVHR
jgi:hypothetical protein